MRLIFMTVAASCIAGDMVDIARSKPSANGSSLPLISLKSQHTACHGVLYGAMFSRAWAIIFSEMSVSVTSQPSPARYAPYLPTPQPMSITRQPGVSIPFSCQKRSSAEL